MQKLLPTIWFNGTAPEAADFYCQTFTSAQILSSSNYPSEGLPAGQEELAQQPMLIELEIDGFRIQLLNADDHFSPNPSISFMVNFNPADHADPRAAIDELWAKLSQDGTVLMPLESYDFSDYYGWCADRYGVSWQLILRPADQPKRPLIQPAMLFTDPAQGKAGAASEKYVKVLRRLGPSSVGYRVNYPDDPESILYAEAQIAGEHFIVMDSNVDHDFGFTPGFSFTLLCSGQDEIDAIWQDLAAVEQPCGWCQDEFGVSWQVIPDNMEQLMSKPGAYERLMQMKKIEIKDF